MCVGWPHRVLYLYYIKLFITFPILLFHICILNCPHGTFRFYISRHFKLAEVFKATM